MLAEIEKDPVRRDPEKYYLTLFGEPSPTGTWGMRWEGHHISLHWTLVNGMAIATTPQFFGSNPAEVRDGPQKGTRVLHAEEDLGRALVTALTAEQTGRGRHLGEGARRHPDDQHPQGRDSGEHGPGLQGT